MDQKPVYIKIEEYEEIEAVMRDIRRKAEDARKKFQEIRSLKDKEEMSLKEWEERMDNISKYLDKMNSILNSGA